MKISFTDLKRQYDSTEGKPKQAVLRAIDNFDLINGKDVLDFQNCFSALLKAKHCITTASGTDALFIALKNLGIGPGDEVITPAFSWISSSETITLCGATPVFVDVDPLFYTLDPSILKNKITAKTKAVIAVHLYGQAADIDEIKSICQENNLFLIEDCAQAHLTQYRGQCVGTFGDAAAFSFYPTKNLGAYGDAGCITTNNDELAERVKRFSNHGALKKDDHLLEGMNSRMDTLQAAILLAKLPYLEEWNSRRLQHAELYNEIFNGQQGVVTPRIRDNTKHTFHIYAIRAERRNELQAYLLSNGIQTLIHYPQALTNLPAYKYLNLNKDDYPVSNALQDEVLSLPIYPELSTAEISYVCESIQAFYRK